MGATGRVPKSRVVGQAQLDAIPTGQRDLAVGAEGDSQDALVRQREWGADACACCRIPPLRRPAARQGDLAVTT